jgi:hypothetical protein
MRTITSDNCEAAEPVLKLSAAGETALTLAVDSTLGVLKDCRPSAGCGGQPQAGGEEQCVYYFHVFHSYFVSLFLVVFYPKILTLGISPAGLKRPTG